MNDYVAAAYLVFLALILIYVVVMAVRQQRLARDIAEIEKLLDRPRDDNAAAREMEPV